MPNTKSAAKRIKTSLKNREGNRAVKTRIATMRRKLGDAIASADASVANTAFSAYCSALDKAVKRGNVKANTASRSKSRAAARIKSL